MWAFPWYNQRPLIGGPGFSKGMRRRAALSSDLVQTCSSPHLSSEGSIVLGTILKVDFSIIYIYIYMCIIYIYIYNYIYIYWIYSENYQQFIFHRFGCFSHTEMGVSWSFHEWDWMGEIPKSRIVENPWAPAEASRSISVEALEMTWDRVQDSLFLKLGFKDLHVVFLSSMIFYVCMCSPETFIWCYLMLFVYSSCFKDDSMIECRVSEGLKK